MLRGMPFTNEAGSWLGHLTSSPGPRVLLAGPPSPEWPPGLLDSPFRARTRLRSPVHLLHARNEWGTYAYKEMVNAWHDHGYNTSQDTHLLSNFFTSLHKSPTTTNKDVLTYTNKQQLQSAKQSTEQFITGDI